MAREDCLRLGGFLQGRDNPKEGGGLQPLQWPLTPTRSPLAGEGIVLQKIIRPRMRVRSARPKSWKRAGMDSVVANHEHLVETKLRVANVPRDPVAHVRLVEGDVVHEHLAVLDPDVLAGQRNDPLHEHGLAVLERQRDDVAAARRREQKRQTVDDEQLAFAVGGEHADAMGADRHQQELRDRHQHRGNEQAANQAASERAADEKLSQRHRTS